MPIRSTSAALLLFGLSFACATSNPTASLQTPDLAGAHCTSDPRLIGDWSSYRMSQLGPSWMRFRFGCDCTFQAKTNVLLLRARESGTFEHTKDEIVFHRPSGATSWPYRFDQGTLVFTESEDEEHRYRQTESRRCEQGAGSPVLMRSAQSPAP